MKTLTKKISAIGFSITMAVSMALSVNASSYSKTEYGVNCYAETRTVANRKGAYASSSKGESDSVGVNIVLYYSDSSGNLKNIGSGNSGKGSTNTTQLTPSGGTFTQAKVTHKWNSMVVYEGSVR